MTDTAPVITFLSDYGLEDDFVGVCHGVIAPQCPQNGVVAHAVDVDRRLSAAVSHGNVAERLGAAVGDALRIRPQ